MLAVNIVLSRSSAEPLERAKRVVFISPRATTSLPHLVVIHSAPADMFMQRQYHDHPCIRASEFSLEPLPIEHPTAEVGSTLPSRKLPRVNVNREFPNIVRQCQHRTATVIRLAQIRNRECFGPIAEFSSTAHVCGRRASQTLPSSVVC